MLVFRDWALMFVRGLKLPVRLGAYGMRGCIRGCVLRFVLGMASAQHLLLGSVPPNRPGLSLARKRSV
ncbi:hypothetical protein NDU88_003649 [Pleurodeles waltl]|uniref:Uncharacterized protein n=1 Tax=Pleurodeles waltl TaxID=8319 RepID=A0AAV7NH91_PLEWA|nr:hypothetical protein NDU88_003649 [Pleurodeles waltl]